MIVISFRYFLTKVKKYCILVEFSEVNSSNTFAMPLLDFMPYKYDILLYS